MNFNLGPLVATLAIIIIVAYLGFMENRLQNQGLNFSSEGLPLRMDPIDYYKLQGLHNQRILCLQ